ncbi:hypothetical protein CPC08DRAFT_755264 [Agrocybe pediades]|nr:hypothetical protein CPC08DRAFT_755264 [Agrocybe pediades]
MHQLSRPSRHATPSSSESRGRPFRSEEGTLLPQKRARSPSPPLASPPRLSLAQRIAEPEALSLVPYNAEFASLHAGLHALAAPVPESLALAFPAPSTSQVPVLSTINEEGRSRFLIIWNLPLYHTWKSVIIWTKGVLTLVPSVRLMRVIRTNVGGEQVFWLAFKSPDQASTFRGQVAGRKAEGGVVVACEFVSQNEYCSVTGNQPPSWEPDADKFTGGLTEHSLLTDLEVARQPSLTLADRLGLQVAPENVWTHPVPLFARPFHPFHSEVIHDASQWWGHRGLQAVEEGLVVNNYLTRLEGLTALRLHRPSDGTVG